MLYNTRILKCFLSPLYFVHKPTCSVSVSNDLPFKKNVFFFPVSVVLPHHSSFVCLQISVAQFSLTWRQILGAARISLPTVPLQSSGSPVSLFHPTLTSFPHFLYFCFNCLLSALYWKRSEVKTTSISFSTSN